jgi:hypothetical protein
MDKHQCNSIKGFEDLLFIDDFDTKVNRIIQLESAVIPDDILIQLIKQNANKDICCWALLKINYINNKEDAKFIVNYLSENDSRIRELSSEVVLRHISSGEAHFKSFFDNTEHYNTYVETISDINPRVTRNITACYTILKNKNLLFDLLVNALTTQKGPFVEYWALEGIIKIIHQCDFNLIEEHKKTLFKTINKIIHSNDHLLKEKVAIILKNLLAITDFKEYERFQKDLNKLKNDPNFFVKQASKDLPETKE